MTKMIDFCKNLACPSSQILVAFQNGWLSSSPAKKVSEHVDSCDFCGAEVDLYSRFPEAEESVPPSEIPAPLLELAEFLMNDRQKDVGLLDKLLIEDQGLKLSEA